ncbi:hypothetical protein ACWD7C_34300 [Streptomyces sp. NPDC005134]|uniref:hypothetical protein n=1 Tax=unclassified Streptomyces TaxID=2593676 RepID=UPI0033B45880
MSAYQPAEPKQPHPRNMGFDLHVAARWVRVDMNPSLGDEVIVCLAAGATVVVAGHGNKAVVAFVAVAALAILSLWCALVPAACIVDYRIGRRVVMLSQRDKSAPDRGLHRGFWPTLQMWAGWSR